MKRRCQRVYHRLSCAPGPRLPSSCWPRLPLFGQTRPLQTEEATTAPGGRMVFETGGEAIANEPSYITGKERTRWDGPLLRVVYSPSDRVELDLEWVALVGASGEAGRADVSDWGDVSLRAKLRLLGAREASPRWAPGSA